MPDGAEDKPQPVGPAASPILPLATAALAAAIFIIDSVTKLEIAVAVFYVVVVLMSVGFCRSRGVMLVSAGCMILTFASYALTPHDSSEAPLINNLISVLAIGTTTYLALKMVAAQRAIHEARAQLAHVARVTTLGELMTSIAHEVNQPLAAMMTNGNACLRWLDAQPPNLAEAGQAIARIVADANRAGEIIGRIRGLAKRNPPRAVQVNINEIIRETLVLIWSELQSNRVALRAQLEEELPLIRGDRIQLQQVILNLILNAAEAVAQTKDGPREIVIATAVDPSGDVRVTVADSGRGFDTARLDQCFDAFYTTKPEGLGIGLTLSRSIVVAHGGRIWATPNAPAGAVFHFVLPKPSGVSR